MVGTRLDLARAGPPGSGGRVVQLDGALGRAGDLVVAADRDHRSVRELHRVRPYALGGESREASPDRSRVGQVDHLVEPGRRPLGRLPADRGHRGRSVRPVGEEDRVPAVPARGEARKVGPRVGEIRRVEDVRVPRGGAGQEDPPVRHREQVGIESHVPSLLRSSEEREGVRVGVVDLGGVVQKPAGRVVQQSAHHECSPVAEEHLGRVPAPVRSCGSRQLGPRLGGRVEDDGGVEPRPGRVRVV